jgi:hypothetical protein
MDWMTGIVSRMLGRGNSLTLVEEHREGGYTFVRSPEFPGFTFMLEPGEEKDLRTVMDALYEPLVAFLEAELRTAARPEPVHVTGFRRTTATKYVAEVCYA